jgi:hypothetical protein
MTNIATQPELYLKMRRLRGEDEGWTMLKLKGKKTQDGDVVWESLGPHASINIEEKGFDSWMIDILNAAIRRARTHEAWCPRDRVFTMDIRIAVQDPMFAACKHITDLWRILEALMEREKIKASVFWMQAKPDTTTKM